MEMKKVLVVVAVLMAAVTTSQAKLTHLLPKPKQVVERVDAPLALNGKISFATPQSERIAAAFALIMGQQVSDEPSAVPVAIELVSTIEGAYDYPLEGYPDEAYQLDVAPAGITIKAVSELSVIHAVQTLAQLAEGCEGEPALECCTITDWPAFKLRGLMHDIGRSFISFETLKRQLPLLARFKVNTFHFHLTENQAWRFEVKQYPQLTEASSMTRFAGCYYTQEQCRELEQLAYNCGITIIPEIDMPGHSQAFQRAMGHSMQTSQGVEELKNILTEVAAVFEHAPYIHIGADEQAITYPNFLSTMTGHIHSLGKKVVVWNPISGVTITTSTGADMTQMWSSSGKVIAGMPNIDCRYNYINHFDLFADLAGIYRSNVYYAQQGSADVAGSVTAVWNDRYIETEEGIIRQNNVWANMLATAERTWMGGGRQYVEQGGAVLPGSGSEYDEFCDWERRFLFHKDNSLRSEPIPYVRQTNVRWQITDAFPNGGDASLVLPPETEGPRDSYTYLGQTYGTGRATGAGVYLRHVWGTIVPGYYANPQLNTTAYAWTYVYSPREQQAGAIIEFQNYSRSEKDLTPANGQWDRKGSRIWLNDVELPGPQWENAGKSITNETPLRNENAAARPPVAITLKQGWNKVFMKLPYVSASNVRLNKWMFTFVITDTEGRHALDGLVYSPRQILDEQAEALSSRIAELRHLVAQVVGTEPGYYDELLAEPLMQEMADIEHTLGSQLPADERAAQMQRLNAAYELFEQVCRTEGPILPTASTDVEEHWYSLCSSLRGSRYMHSNGAGMGLTGNGKTGSDRMMWKFVSRADGSFDIVNRADLSYISPVATYNTQVRTSAQQPSAGWTLKPASTIGMLIVTSGTVELNQTNLTNTPIYNWSNTSTLGNDITDTGCQFAIREVYPPSPDDVTIRIAGTDDVNAPESYGSWDATPWAHRWTSHADNGIGGVELSSPTAQFGQASGIYSRYVLALQPSAPGATDVVTITAPEGYYVKAYSMQTRLFTANEPYLLYNAQNSVTPVTTEWREFGADGLHDQSATFSIASQGSANSRYLCVSDFTVTLHPTVDLGISTPSGPRHSAAQDAVYDLSGRRIQGDKVTRSQGNLPKGIYIVNRQKTIVR